MSLEATTGMHAVIGGVIAWLLKKTYDHNACARRIEQKIDSFIEEYRSSHK